MNKQIQPEDFGLGKVTEYEPTIPKHPDQPQVLEDKDLRYALRHTKVTAYAGGKPYVVNLATVIQKDDIDELMRLFASQRQAWEREAEKRGVAWSVSVIDEMHFDDNSTAGDRTYKGIKNTIRDRYKSVTGIDPAPEYPVKAKLTSAKEKQFDENIT